MKKTNKKLSLTKETVRVLTNSELGGVAGGVLTTAMTCTTSLVICPKPDHNATKPAHGPHRCVQTTYMTCPR
jgi:hypothetical protein